MSKNIEAAETAEMEMLPEMEQECGPYVITDATIIEQRPDGSYVLDGIYHVALAPEFEKLIERIEKVVAEQPERLVKLPESSAEELLAEARAAKLEELGLAFDAATLKPTCEVDGLVIDANDTANTNVDGLIKKLQALGSEGPVEFCLADNSTANVDLATLKKFQLAIIDNGQRLYAQKWALRTQIEAAQDEASLAAIQIGF
ncbi:MAG: DUF4376 domain-containing protein [Desulfovibrio sp.]|nr:DUF4376 domain-containing protein [Desulfovibrio sp.]